MIDLLFNNMLNFLIKNSIGINIADRSIEIVQLVGGGRVVQIKSINRIKFNAGIITNGRITDRNKLTTIIKKLLVTAKPVPIKAKEIFFTVPEAQTYTHIFTLTNYNKENKQLIKDEIDRTIPIVSDNMIYSSKIIYHTSKLTEILVVAARRDIMKEWQDFFLALKINIKFDIEIFAARRAILEEKNDETNCLIDFGATTTQLAIFDKKTLKMSYSFYKAGEYLNEELANYLSVNLIQAAKLKKEINLNKKNKKADALKKVLEPIITEIKISIQYWQDKSEKKIKQLILLGGSSQIKGLVEYFSSQFKLPVVLAHSNLTDKKASLLYLNAIGSALRGINSFWRQDPLLEISLSKKIKTKKQLISRHKQHQPSKDLILKNKSRILFLLTLLIVSILVLVIIFLYRHYDNKQKIVQQQEKQDKLTYNFSKTIQLSLPVAIDKIEYTPDRIPGRIIDNNNNLKASEELWPQAIKQNPLQWLVFDSKVAQQLFISALDKKINDAFIFSSLDYLDLISTDNPNIYFISAKINFLTQTDINIQTPTIEHSPLSETELIEEPIIEQIIITNTPTGWLNIRRGPGTNYEIITKANVGEKFIFLDQEDGWTKIKLSDNQEGWASTTYVEKIK